MIKRTIYILSLFFLISLNGCESDNEAQQRFDKLEKPIVMKVKHSSDAYYGACYIILSDGKGKRELFYDNTPIGIDLYKNYNVNDTIKK